MIFHCHCLAACACLPEHLDAYPIHMRRWAQNMDESSAEIPWIAWPGLGKSQHGGRSRGPFLGPQGPRVLPCFQPNIYSASVYWAPMCWVCRDKFFKRIQISRSKVIELLRILLFRCLMWRAHRPFTKRRSDQIMKCLDLLFFSVNPTGFSCLRRM